MPRPNPFSPHAYTPPSTHTLGLNFAVDPCDRLSHQCHPSRQPGQGVCEHLLWVRCILVGLKVSPEVNPFLTTVKLCASALVATGFSSAKTIKGLKISSLLSSVHTLSADSVWLSETLRCSCLTCVILVAGGMALYGEKQPPQGQPGPHKGDLSFETGSARIFAEGLPPSPQPPAGLLPFRKGQCSYSSRSEGPSTQGRCHPASCPAAKPEEMLERVLLGGDQQTEAVGIVT